MLIWAAIVASFMSLYSFLSMGGTHEAVPPTRGKPPAPSGRQCDTAGVRGEHWAVSRGDRAFVAADLMGWEPSAVKVTVRKRARRAFRWRGLRLRTPFPGPTWLRGDGVRGRASSRAEYRYIPGHGRAQS